jgi:hypothetical protein
MSLQIRGIGSFYGSTSPLYVIDGVQIRALYNPLDGILVDVGNENACWPNFGSYGRQQFITNADIENASY